MVIQPPQPPASVFLPSCCDLTATDTLSQLLTAAHQQIAKEAFGTKEIERQVEEEDNEGGREKPQNWTEMEDGEKREEGEKWLEMKARKSYKKF